MSAEIKAKMVAYRKAKEEARQRHESALEHMRWHIGMGVLAEFPNAELHWQTIENHPSRVLGVEIRVGDYAVAGYIIHEHLEHPQVALTFLIAEINAELSKGPIRHLFE
jgi:hypothetical protein